MIKCENLTAGYYNKEVLHKLNWELEEGLITVIVGPNGSGKSTFLKSIMGYATVREGNIFLDGKKIKQYNSRELAQKIAYLPQNRSDTNITVGKMVLHGRFPYLTYPRHYTKEDRKVVDEALSQMGIEQFKNMPVSELSGGEKQKTYLSMALTQDSPILFLDEPAVYLDLSWQLELMDLLVSLKEKGKTIVTVLHDLNHALLYADRVIVMEQGHIRQYGTPKQVLESKILERVFDLRISSVTDMDGRLQYCFARKK